MYWEDEQQHWRAQRQLALQAGLPLADAVTELGSLRAMEKKGNNKHRGQRNATIVLSSETGVAARSPLHAGSNGMVN